jgi:hypothetical protein
MEKVWSHAEKQIETTLARWHRLLREITGKPMHRPALVRSDVRQVELFETAKGCEIDPRACGLCPARRNGLEE